MKKIFVKLCSVAAIGLALTACNNDAANKTAIDGDNNVIDQMVADKMKMMDDSIGKACDAQVIAAADTKIDSMAKAGHKTAMAHVAHHAAPKTKVEPKKPDPIVGNKVEGTKGAPKDDKVLGTKGDAKTTDKVIGTK